MPWPNQYSHIRTWAPSSTSFTQHLPSVPLLVSLSVFDFTSHNVCYFIASTLLHLALLLHLHFLTICIHRSHPILTPLSSSNTCTCDRTSSTAPFQRHLAFYRRLASTPPLSSLSRRPASLFVSYFLTSADFVYSRARPLAIQPSPSSIYTIYSVEHSLPLPPSPHFRDPICDAARPSHSTAFLACDRTRPPLPTFSRSLLDSFQTLFCYTLPSFDRHNTNYAYNLLTI